MGERRPCKAEVVGSNPICSTTFLVGPRRIRGSRVAARAYGSLDQKVFDNSIG